MCGKVCAHWQFEIVVPPRAGSNRGCRAGNFAVSGSISACYSSGWDCSAGHLFAPVTAGTWPLRKPVSFYRTYHALLWGVAARRAGKAAPPEPWAGPFVNALASGMARKACCCWRELQISNRRIGYSGLVLRVRCLMPSRAGVHGAASMSAGPADFRSCVVPDFIYPPSLPARTVGDPV